MNIFDQYLDKVLNDKKRREIEHTQFDLEYSVNNYFFKSPRSLFSVMVKSSMSGII